MHLRNLAYSLRDRYVSMVGQSGKEILDLLVKEIEEMENK